MKRLLYASAAALFVLSACDKTKIDGDLQFELAGESTIRVVSSDATFSPDGGNGTIVIESETEFSVKSSRDWCEIQAEGDTLNVKVGAYYEMQNRYSLITVKNAAGDSVNVTVHQYGAVIQDFDDSGAYMNNEGGVVNIGYASNMRPIVETSLSWVTTEVFKDKIAVTFAKNDTTFRKGELLCKLGPVSYTVPVAQLDSTEILSKKNWEICGISAANDTTILPCTISKSMKGIRFKISGTGPEGATVAWEFEAKTEGNNLLIPLGEQIGRYKPADTNYYVIPVVLEGSSAIKAGDGIDSGYFKAALDKNAEGKWYYKGEDVNLRFEYWELQTRPNPSKGGLRFKDFILCEK